MMKNFSPLPILSRSSTYAFAGLLLAIGSGCGGEDILGAAAYAGPTEIDIVRGESREIALDLGRKLEEIEGDIVRQTVSGLPSGVTVVYASQDISIGNPDLKRTFATVTATTLSSLGSFNVLFSRTGTIEPAGFN